MGPPPMSPYGAPPPPPGYGYGVPPAPPPPAKRPVWPWVLGGVVLLIVVLGFVGLAVGSEGDDESDDDPDSDDATGEVVDVAPATGPTVTSGALSITLPEGWVGADTSQGTEGLAALVFPDDADAAEEIESAFGFLPRAIVLVGVDVEDARERRFMDSINVLQDVSVPNDMSLPDVLDAEADGIERVGGGEVEESELIELGGRTVGRIQFSGVPGATVVSYVLQEENGDVYVVTATFGDLDDEALALADSSVATFAVAG